MSFKHPFEATSDSNKIPLYTQVVSWVVLIPLLDLLVKGGFSFFGTNLNTPVAHAGNVLLDTGSDTIPNRIQQFSIYLIILFLVFGWSRPITRKLCSRQSIGLLALPIWALMSTTWSQDPAKSFVSAIYVFVVLFLGVYMRLRFSQEDQVSLLLLLGWSAIILSLGMVLFYPQAGIEHLDGNGAWQGIFHHKQNCGTAMLYLLVVPFCVKERGFLTKVWLGIYVFFVCLLLIMCQSRTGWLTAGCLAAFLVSIAVLRKFADAERVMAAALIVTCSALIVALLIANMSQIALLLGKDPTLTGRTRIWGAIESTLWKRPWLGYGYRAFWTGMKGDAANVVISSGDVGFVNAENPVLGVWLDLGLVGVGCMFLMLLQSCKNAVICLRRRPSGYVVLCSGFVLLHMLALVGGDPIMYPHTIEWLLYVVAFFGLSDEARRLRSQRAR